jgi:hypothetical protein
MYDHFFRKEVSGCCGVQRSDIALWPPSLINRDKSSLSAGAFKVLSTQCALQIKISHEQKVVESTSVLWKD